MYNILILLVLSATPWAWATHAPPTPTLEVFRSHCAKNRAGHDDFVVPTPPLRQRIYLPVKALEATQTRFSFDRLLRSLEKVIRKEGLTEPTNHLNWVFNHDGGHALYPEVRRITGIYFRGKVYVVDGHHRALISTYLGAQTIPVEILEDWSHKSPQRFFYDLADRGYSYYRNYKGESVAPLDLCELQDDPYLFLARQILLRIDFNLADDGQVEVLEARGPERVIAAKLNRDIPFLEFELADRIRRSGFQWDVGQTLKMPQLKKMLRSLQKDRDQSRLAPVLLFDKPQNVAKLNISKVVKAHIERVTCEAQLLPGDSD